jgi:DNA (cytosine-5)-methyltransferase 1
MTRTIGSLFTGYGGLDLAVASAYGARTVWTCDNDPGASMIIAARFPKAPNLGDITTVDWAGVRKVDILTGGWPCQPWSVAGRRKGNDDHRALWPYLAEAVRVLRPRVLLLENVANIARAGELARAVGDLASLGYVGSWLRLCASDVGAPHRRERIFIVARDSSGTRSQRRTQGWLQPGLPGETGGPTAHADDSGSAHGFGRYGIAVRHWELTLGRKAPAPTEPRPTGGRRLSPLFTEWMMGLPEGWVTEVDGLTRKQQLSALGNGVVPQQAVAAIAQCMTYV